MVAVVGSPVVQQVLPSLACQLNLDVNVARQQHINANNNYNHNNYNDNDDNEYLLSSYQ